MSVFATVVLGVAIVGMPLTAVGKRSRGNLSARQSALDGRTRAGWLTGLKWFLWLVGAGTGLVWLSSGAIGWLVLSCLGTSAAGVLLILE
jgi:hypothetical protein